MEDLVSSLACLEEDCVSADVYRTGFITCGEFMFIVLRNGGTHEQAQALLSKYTSLQTAVGSSGASVKRIDYVAALADMKINAAATADAAAASTLILSGGGRRGEASPPPPQHQRHQQPVPSVENAREAFAHLNFSSFSDTSARSLSSSPPARPSGSSGTVAGCQEGLLSQAIISKGRSTSSSSSTNSSIARRCGSSEVRLRSDSPATSFISSVVRMARSHSNPSGRNNSLSMGMGGEGESGKRGTPSASILHGCANPTGHDSTPAAAAVSGVARYLTDEAGKCGSSLHSHVAWPQPAPSIQSVVSTTSERRALANLDVNTSMNRSPAAMNYKVVGKHTTATVTSAGCASSSVLGLARLTPVREIFRCIDESRRSEVTLQQVFDLFCAGGIDISFLELEAVAESLDLKEFRRKENAFHFSQDASATIGASSSQCSGVNCVEESDCEVAEGEYRLGLTDFCLLVSRLRPRTIECIRRCQIWRSLTQQQQQQQPVAAKTPLGVSLPSHSMRPGTQALLPTADVRKNDVRWCVDDVEVSPATPASQSSSRASRGYALNCLHQPSDDEEAEAFIQASAPKVLFPNTWGTEDSIDQIDIQAAPVSTSSLLLPAVPAAVEQVTATTRLQAAHLHPSLCSPLATKRPLNRDIDLAMHTGSPPPPHSYSSRVGIQQQQQRGTVTSLFAFTIKDDHSDSSTLRLNPRDAHSMRTSPLSPKERKVSAAGATGDISPPPRNPHVHARDSGSSPIMSTSSNPSPRLLQSTVASRARGVAAPVRREKTTDTASQKGQNNNSSGSGCTNARRLSRSTSRSPSSSVSPSQQQRYGSSSPPVVRVSLPGKQRSRSGSNNSVNTQDSSPQTTRMAQTARIICAETLPILSASRTPERDSAQRSPPLGAIINSSNVTTASPPLTNSSHATPNGSPVPRSRKCTVSTAVMTKLQGKCTELLTACTRADAHHTGGLSRSALIAVLRAVCPALSTEECDEVADMAWAKCIKYSPDGHGDVLCAYVRLVGELVVNESYARLPASQSPSPVQQDRCSDPPVAHADCQQQQQQKEQPRHARLSKASTHVVLSKPPVAPPPAARPSPLHNAGKLHAMMKDAFIRACKGNGEALRDFFFTYDDIRVGYLDIRTFRTALHKLFSIASGKEDDRGRGGARNQQKRLHTDTSGCPQWLLDRAIDTARLPFESERLRADTGRTPAARTEAETAARERVHRVPEGLWGVLCDYRYLLEDMGF